MKAMSLIGMLAGAVLLYCVMYGPLGAVAKIQSKTTVERHDTYFAYITKRSTLSQIIVNIYYPFWLLSTKSPAFESASENYLMWFVGVFGSLGMADSNRNRK